MTGRERTNRDYFLNVLARWKLAVEFERSLALPLG
jgi:hypothetical protein